MDCRWDGIGHSDNRGLRQQTAIALLHPFPRRRVRLHDVERAAEAVGGEPQPDLVGKARPDLDHQAVPIYAVRREELSPNRADAQVPVVSYDRQSLEMSSGGDHANANRRQHRKAPLWHRLVPADEIRRFFRARGKHVISFAGFGELGYEEDGIVDRLVRDVVAPGRPIV